MSPALASTVAAPAITSSEIDRDRDQETNCRRSRDQCLPQIAASLLR